VSDTSGLDKAQSIYENPQILTGTIYSRDAKAGQPLFRLKRVATRDGSMLRVLREYSYPDGKLAAREHVVYEGNSLSVFELEELQTGAAGSATIEPNAQHPSNAFIAFQYAANSSTRTKPKIRREPLQPDTLVNDMVGPFLAGHYDRLLRGEKVECRYVVISRKETIGFTFVKDSESKWRGKDVLILKMEPTSPLISALVNPLFFTIEKAPPHRVLQYAGRTTPKGGEDGRWKDLDAITVFDW
jgi:hypothetical protein